MTGSSADEILTRAEPDCPVCRSQGVELYAGMRDRLFGAPGDWRLKVCKNTVCGLAWLDPMPREDQIARAYRHYYTHAAQEGARQASGRLYLEIANAYVAARYGYRDVAVCRTGRWLRPLVALIPGRRLDFELSVMCLPAAACGTLLEVGCGSGEFLARMRQFGWVVEGVDPDPRAVQQAAALGLAVYESDLWQRAYADNRFDAIVLSHVIEHVPDPEALMRECWRILKPGGRMVIVTPNIQSWGHARFGADWRGLEPPRHLQIFSIAALRTLCERAGFGRVNCRSIAHARVIWMASWGLRAGRRLDLATPAPALVRRWADVMELVEYFRIKLDPCAGEELLLRAVK